MPGSSEQAKALCKIEQSLRVGHNTILLAPHDSGVEHVASHGTGDTYWSAESPVWKRVEYAKDDQRPRPHNEVNVQIRNRRTHWHNYRIKLPRWITRLAVNLAFTRSSIGWMFSLTLSKQSSRSAPIFQAIYRGDLDSVRRLTETGRASPRDTFVDERSDMEMTTLRVSVRSHETVHNVLTRQGCRGSKICPDL